MPMSCNFPMECRRWASTSSFWLVSFYFPCGLPSHGTLDGTVGLTGWDVVRWCFVGMRVSFTIDSSQPLHVLTCPELWNMLRGTKPKMLSRLSATRTSWAAWSTSER